MRPQAHPTRSDPRSLPPAGSTLAPARPVPNARNRCSDASTRPSCPCPCRNPGSLTEPTAASPRHRRPSSVRRAQPPKTSNAVNPRRHHGYLVSCRVSGGCPDSGAPNPARRRRPCRPCRRPGEVPRWFEDCRGPPRLRLSWPEGSCSVFEDPPPRKAPSARNQQTRQRPRSTRTLMLQRSRTAPVAWSKRPRPKRPQKPWTRLARWPLPKMALHPTPKPILRLTPQ